MKTGVLVVTFIALIIIAMVGVYNIPFGLRGIFSEGFQVPPTVGDSSVEVAQDPVNMPEMPQMPEMSEMPDMPEMREMPNTNIKPAAPQQMSVTTTKVGKQKPSSLGMPQNQPQMAEDNRTPEEFQNASPSMNQAMQHKNAVKEGFRTNYAEVSGGARDQYQPIGAFDGVALPTGNNVSSWRYTSPDEPLLGAPFELGNDSLFMFKNNQCKPSCCGSSLSCSGGCVCTTPDQRQFIAGRGGNRTKPAED